MSETKVEQFASELGLLPAALLEQLKAAGVSKKLANDSLTEEDKAQLLNYLRKAHGTNDEKGKITLTRRQTSEIRKSDSTGKAHTIQVEVRKKRVFVKPEEQKKIEAEEAKIEVEEEPNNAISLPVPPSAPTSSMQPGHVSPVPILQNSPGQASQLLLLPPALCSEVVPPLWQ